MVVHDGLAVCAGSSIGGVLMDAVDIAYTKYDVAKELRNAINNMLGAISFARDAGDALSFEIEMIENLAGVVEVMEECLQRESSIVLDGHETLDT